MKIKQTILNVISTPYPRIAVALGITLVLSVAIGSMINVEHAFAALDEVDVSP